MVNILDHVTVKRPLAWFRPTTVRELFVLRLAQKLGEPAAAEHYAELARRHSDETLLLAYRRTINHGHPNYNPQRIPEIIRAAHQRLQGVQIESLPYEQILERYDRPTTMFYLDPPYWQRKLYRFNFSDEDFRQLERRLHKISGRFVLSLD